LAQLKDVPSLVALINSAYRGDSSRLGWTTEADLLDGIRTDEFSLTALLEDPDGTLFVYTLEAINQIIGCVYLKRSEGKLYLGMLTVSPQRQAQGIGKKLLAAAEAYALENHIPAIFMTVITQRVELIDWYQRHGYIKTGERRPFPSDSKFGLPKQPLEFEVLEKKISSGKDGK